METSYEDAKEYGAKIVWGHQLSGTCDPHLGEVMQLPALQLQRQPRNISQGFLFVIFAG